MAVWDLATRENWSLILSERRIARVVDDQAAYYRYEAINPIYANPNSNIILVGTYSEKAEPHWFLGARVSQYLYVSPSTNTHLISGVQASETKRVGLNRLTLLQFPDYNILPYALQLEIPYWLEDIYVEVWEYEGNYLTPELQEIESIRAQLHDLEDSLSRIEQKIDALPALPNSSSPGNDNPYYNY